MIRITLTVDILQDEEFRTSLLEEGKELALEGIIDTLWPPQSGRQLVIGSTAIRQEQWL